MNQDDFNINQREIASFSCVTVDALPEDKAPSAIAIICHGYGASGHDLVGLGPEWIAASEPIRNNMRFVFPAAPIVLGMSFMGESRAWWPIDMVALEHSMATGTPRIRRDELPEELEARQAEIIDLVKVLQEESGLGIDRFVFGGFSQGSMLTTDVVLSLDDNPLGQVIFSGTLLCEDRWREAAPKRAGFPIFQSHGRQDPLLRYEEAEALRDLLGDAGASVTFEAFDGEHTIGPSAMSKAKDYLEERLATLG